jgi:hypothetical protein
MTQPIQQPGDVERPARYAGLHTPAFTGRPPTMPVPPIVLRPKHQTAWRVFAVVAVVTAFFVGMAIGVGIADPSSAPQTAVPAGVTASHAPAAASPTTARTAGGTHAPTLAPSGPARSFGDGTWQVGQDITAGTYVTTVPADSLGCYWERDKDASGAFDSILSNDNVAPGGHVVLNVGTAKYVQSNGCGTWRLR